MTTYPVAASRFDFCHDGSLDIARAAQTLAARLPEPLAPLARLAYNFWWSWTPGGPELFQSLDPHWWERCGRNPVRLLQEIAPDRLHELARDSALVADVHALVALLDAEMERSDEPLPGSGGRPVAFMCAEFGIHDSLPFYSGGLGVLAGDILKEASDRALPVVGVGLMYWQGFFHQRLDSSGWQHEYWRASDAERLPAALVTGPDGSPRTITVSVRGRDVVAQIWRLNIGRTPLYLLDAGRPENRAADRWITGRLYVGDHETRLAQYTLLGVGGVYALRALGIEPALLHLNEGHAALASIPLIGEQIAQGHTLDEAMAIARAKTVFTTHTPVAAGNETYTVADVQAAVDGLPARFGIPWERFMALGETRPEAPGERFGMTQLAMRTSSAANGVSRLHGEVARTMWRPLWPDRAVEDVPVEHVTNGVHLPTWMAPAMQELLEKHLGAGWRTATGPGAWAAIDNIPDEDLWATRCRLRENLVRYVRGRSIWDRLGRGESVGYAESAAQSWDPNRIVVGFARRIATYKRLYLLSIDPQRSVRLISGHHPIQMVIAGKAHPQDEEAKRTVQHIFGLDDLPNVGEQVVFLEDYDMDMATRLVRGCDVWVNLPRPPMEASGTSGMKSALNGGLQLSVLDGWWAEAYDGANGWAIGGQDGLDPAAQDARDAAAFLDLLEYEVLPLFYARDGHGIPHCWVQRIKQSLKTIGPPFTATRMLGDYAARYSARME
ncbi:MAG: alpha-glucan family phosphorylase [Chloroflexi bacterium]|nr:alpha-glucan family phosphorylase [Chloroflexota bacterium]